MSLTMQTPNTQCSSPSTPSPLSQTYNTESRTPASAFSSPSPSSLRHWRPAAQRNLKNQWLKLLSHKQQWFSASSSGRNHATDLANKYLSRRYLPAMDLGVLKDMPNIREKAGQKLAKQQELYRSNLLSSYKDMVHAVCQMVNTSSSMRCFLKGPVGSSLVQFSNCCENENDLGDGGGSPVFTFWSVSYFENLAREVVEMFQLELILKRLLVIELLSISCEEHKGNNLSWSDNLYPGELGDLSSSNLYSEQSSQPVPPRIKGHEPSSLSPSQSKIQPDEQVLQVYIRTWLTEVNINSQRLEEIFSVVGEEMHVNLS